MGDRRKSFGERITSSGSDKLSVKVKETTAGNSEESQGKAQPRDLDIDIFGIRQQ